MKTERLIPVALILSALVFLLEIGFYMGGTDKKDATEHNVAEADTQVATKEPVFDLQYDKYLVEAPYTYEMNGMQRSFRFKRMLEYIAIVDADFGKGPICYIDNYQNRNGAAPFYYGASQDAYGVNRSASAPAYPDRKNPEEFRYLEDGTLVIVLEDKDKFTVVQIVGDESGKKYYIPERYVPTNDCLTSFTKAIVIDRANQNIAAFEAEDGIWRVVSYSFATTGMEGEYHSPTPLGFFFAIEKRERFYYLKDGTKDVIEGYAPYAIRFTQGAYIHGVSTAYRHDVEGNRIDPGIREFSSTVGTIPLSHKCVRNYTSHAKFLYDWYEHGNTAVIVME